jgi:hypothetical protein
MAGNWKNFNLIIKKAAPGLYFVVFGSIVISTTIYKGFSSTDYSREEQPINKPPVITSLPSLINDTFNLKK